MTAYIHANPVRAACADDALDFRWSTHVLHAGAPARCEVAADLWTPSGWYRGLADNEAQRGERYLEAYEDYRVRGVQPEHVSDLELLEAISLVEETWERRPDGTRAVDAPEDSRKDANDYGELKP